MKKKNGWIKKKSTFYFKDECEKNKEYKNENKWRTFEKYCRIEKKKKSKTRILKTEIC